jgi:hypothetical protein
MSKVFSFDDIAGLGTFYTGSEVAEHRLGDCASPHKYRCPIDTSFWVSVRSVISASQSRPKCSLARNRDKDSATGNTRLQEFGGQLIRSGIEFA